MYILYVDQNKEVYEKWNATCWSIWWRQYGSRPYSAYYRNRFSLWKLGFTPDPVVWGVWFTYMAMEGFIHTRNLKTTSSAPGLKLIMFTGNSLQCLFASKGIMVIIIFSYFGHQVTMLWLGFPLERDGSKKRSCGVGLGLLVSFDVRLSFLPRVVSTCYYFSLISYFVEISKGCKSCSGPSC